MHRATTTPASLIPAVWRNLNLTVCKNNRRMLHNGTAFAMWCIVYQISAANGQNTLKTPYIAWLATLELGYFPNSPEDYTPKTP